MEENTRIQEEIYSKSLRCGRRTYFFDVRATKAEDYYLTITESKRYFNEDGSAYYKKHKIYLYKEDFKDFAENLNEITDYIIKEKGEEIISDTPKKQSDSADSPRENVTESSENDKDQSKFTDVNFEDI